MNVDLSRRSFLKLTGARAAATTLGAMGFGAAEAATAASVRAFKLATTTETRNICTYCSVACGIIMYSRGDLAAGEKAELAKVQASRVAWSMTRRLNGESGSEFVTLRHRSASGPG